MAETVLEFNVVYGVTVRLDFRSTVLNFYISSREVKKTVHTFPVGFVRPFVRVFVWLFTTRCHHDLRSANT